MLAALAASTWRELQDQLQTEAEAAKGGNCGRDHSKRRGGAAEGGAGGGRGGGGRKADRGEKSRLKVKRL